MNATRPGLSSSTCTGVAGGAAPGGAIRPAGRTAIWISTTLEPLAPPSVAGCDRVITSGTPGVVSTECVGVVTAASIAVLTLEARVALIEAVVSVASRNPTVSYRSLVDPL